MIKKILDEHRAAIHLSNRTDRSGNIILGAQVDILFEHLAPDRARRHDTAPAGRPQTQAKAPNEAT